MIYQLAGSVEMIDWYRVDCKNAPSRGRVTNEWSRWAHRCIYEVLSKYSVHTDEYEVM